VVVVASAVVALTESPVLSASSEPPHAANPIDATNVIESK